MGVECVCGAAVAPAFKLHNTALIFTTEDKYLQVKLEAIFFLFSAHLIDIYASIYAPRGILGHFI